ncbi:MAG: hypothetical protein JWM35_588 [Verrucomicrobia bacterium]|nr:hypothetical protein [Verrucomicrobiota bacterium]
MVLRQASKGPRQSVFLSCVVGQRPRVSISSSPVEVLEFLNLSPIPIPMKLSSFLAQRHALLEQARLANLAFAYERLSEFRERLAKTRLRGDLRIRQATLAGDPWSSLTATHGSQSIIEEHFTDEDLMDFADIVAFTMGETELDLTFRIEELDPRFLRPLRLQLEQAGVAVDLRGRP